MARRGLPALLIAALAAGPSCGGTFGDRLGGAEPHTASPEAYEQYLLGAIAAENGDHETAAARFEAAIALDPDDPFLRVERAEALTACGRHDDARAELERALALDPALPEAAAALAELRRRATAP
jgi:predicted Zn-dependent protease